VRLAFAVAAHLDFEILVVDEVLAVGDLEFQKKCLSKMGDISSGGRTVLFVSHNLGIIHRLCSRTLVLRNGQTQLFGPTDDAIRTYLFESLEHQGQWERPTSAQSSPEVCLHRVRVLNRSGSVTGLVACDESFQIAIEYEVLQATPNFEIALGLRNSQGT